MADETPQVPTVTQAATPSFFDKFSMSFGDLWANHKLFLIGCGALILIVKFREVLIDILVSSSKTLIADTKKQSDVLVTQENEANKQANDLIAKAKEEPSKNTPSDDDWYKK